MAIEFKSKISDQKLLLNKEVVQLLRLYEDRREVKVILLFEEEEEKKIKEYTLNRFIAGYDDQVMVYDSL